MVSTNGQLYSVAEGPSGSKLNAKSIVVGTGTYINGIPPTIEAPLALCTADGAGLKKDWLYQRVFADEGYYWVPVFKAHYHDTSDDGMLYDIVDRNVGNFNMFHYTPHKELFHFNTIGAGSNTSYEETTTTTSLNLNTGTNTNDAITAYDSASQINFGYAISMNIIGFLSASSSVLFRCGPGMERADAGTDVLNKIGIEACGATSATILAASANGVARNAEDTLEGSAPGAFRGYSLRYSPGGTLLFKASSGVTKSKSTNIPTSGNIDANKMIRMGVKATAASTARTFKFLRMQLLVKAVSTLWVGY